MLGGQNSHSASLIWFLNNYFASTSLLLNFRSVVLFISNALVADQVRRRGCVSNGREKVLARGRASHLTWCEAGN